MKAFGDEDTIFEDMDVLNPNEQTYQPESLPEREVELDQIHSALRPATMGSTPLNLIVYGQSGQGKTVGIRLKTDQLQEYADGSEMDLTVVHIRCKGMDGSYHVPTHLVKRLREKRFGPGEELPSGHQRKTLLNMVIENLEKIGGTVIVVLDEIDAIGDDDYILYELPRSNPTVSVSRSSGSRTISSSARTSTPMSGQASAKTRSASSRTMLISFATSSHDVPSVPSVTRISRTISRTISISEARF